MAAYRISQPSATVASGPAPSQAPSLDHLHQLSQQMETVWTDSATSAASCRRACPRHRRFPALRRRLLCPLRHPHLPRADRQCPCYCSCLFVAACHYLGIRHLRTRSYTPRTNGKAERFIQTAQREWAARLYQSRERQPSSNLGFTTTTGIARILVWAVTTHQPRRFQRGTAS